MVINIESPKCSLVCWDAIPGPSLSELRGCGLVARCKPPKRNSPSPENCGGLCRRASPVAMVHPVVAVSPGAAVLARLRVATVVSVLVMRWFSSVHEGLKSSNRTKRV
jgi:hypothetical protein